MRILLLAASALALTMGTSSLAEGPRGGGKPERAQQGGGGGHQARGRDRGPQMAQRGGGKERQGRGAGGPDRGPQAGSQRGAKPDRKPQAMAQRGGPDREVRGGDMRGNGRGNGGEDRGRPARGGAPEQVRQNGQERLAAPGQSRERGAARLTQRRAMPVQDPASLARLRWEPEQAVARGCPPGLAKKNNGCLPPGQTRQLLQQQREQQNWYQNWWAYPAATNYLYDDGYLLGLNGDSVDSFIPLLGGALWQGQTWPESYEAQPVPDYHIDYFGLQDGYDYRFADGAIYGVDPTTQLIQNVSALIAGDEWAIGQRMPAGYDIYNVPYEYRDDYQDTPESLYRYADGYVYQVDPTTQLIQAAIQLIT